MKKLLLFAAVIAVSFTSFAQVGIGTTNPAGSAALDITSTTKGLLLPRMTSTQRKNIAIPVVGLIVYCTNCGLNGEMVIYNGTSWVNVVGGAVAPAYQEVTSSTGKTWMDRNLGDTQVATSSSDAASYGDLYQWGRNTDGHEKRNNSTTSSGPVTIASDYNNFITTSSSPYDWLSPQVGTRWNGSNKGIHDPCPSGFRVPTDAEWEAERGSFAPNNAAGAFTSVLKLPLAGRRDRSNGTLLYEGSNGYYWSSTVMGTGAHTLRFTSTNAIMSPFYRAYGFSVRCIKD